MATLLFEFTSPLAFELMPIQQVAVILPHPLLPHQLLLLAVIFLVFWRFYLIPTLLLLLLDLWPLLDPLRLLLLLDLRLLNDPLRLLLRLDLRLLLDPLRLLLLLDLRLLYDPLRLLLLLDRWLLSLLLDLLLLLLFGCGIVLCGLFGLLRLLVVGLALGSILLGENIAA